MQDGLELKTIGADGIERALDKADRYRLLNDPQQAESICQDVLEVEPDNERARRTLLLTLTDQFADSTVPSRIKQARELAASLGTDYDRAYYRGIVAEREARALLGRGPAASFAYELFRRAITEYERAADHRPAGDDDALLRYNACVRTIRAHSLRPPPDDRELPLE
jgi:SOS response regulatory protein OraA/RecX